MPELEHTESNNKLAYSQEELQEEWNQQHLRSIQEGTLPSTPWKKFIRVGMVAVLFFSVLVLGTTGLVWLSNYFPTNVTSVQATDEKHFNRSTFDNAAVASEHPICSNLGKQAMQKGGSAVDVAIVGLLCIGVINNQSSGLGGGGFMLIKEVGKEAEMLDFRETAPGKSHRDMFKKDPQASRAGKDNYLFILLLCRWHGSGCTWRGSGNA